MPCCAIGPCDRYLAAGRSFFACRVCWWGDQPQPDRLAMRSDPGAGRSGV